MEQIGKLVVQQANNLQVSSQTNSVAIHNGEISVYSGELNTTCIIDNTVKIKKAFPSLPIDFFDVFTDRLKENGFSDERLKDAVNNVIDTCIYPTPTIAQFISFDKRIKVFTYDEMMMKWEYQTGGSYQAVLFPNKEKAVWIHKNDIKEYKLEEFILQP